MELLLSMGWSRCFEAKAKARYNKFQFLDDASLEPPQIKTQDFPVQQQVIEHNDGRGEGNWKDGSEKVGMQKEKTFHNSEEDEKVGNEPRMRRTVR